MRVLVLGGTVFVGPPVVRELVARGHDVTVLHRGEHEGELPSDVEHVHGDFARFDRVLPELRRWEPDVVLDMCAFRAEDGDRVLRFAGVARRAIVVSSADVYRAFGRLHRTEPGPPDPVPLSEDAPLREKLTDAGRDYDKVGVERRLRSQIDLPVTILRLPGVHGPGDYLHRLYPYVKRMDDARPVILLDEKLARWRWIRGYVENVAHAIALATTDDRAEGQTYNVADESFTEREWVEEVARAHGWRGEIRIAPGRLLPDYLRCTFDARQHVVLDTTRIRRELGYREVVSVAEGLARTIAWERTEPPVTSYAWADDFDYPAEDEAFANAERHRAENGHR
jgi:nucleoside-diphosphate-sugar epimerase